MTDTQAPDVVVTEAEPWPGCYSDLQQRRVTTLAKLGLMLSVMASGEAAEVLGYDAADLYTEVLMALAIEDADDTDIALEEARDHPDGDMLARLSTQSAMQSRIEELVEALREIEQRCPIFAAKDDGPDEVAVEVELTWRDLHRIRKALSNFGGSNDG